MAGVGARDAVTVVAFDPAQSGVAEPVGGAALRGDPGQQLAEAGPEVVVAAAGQDATVAIPQEAVGGQYGAAAGGVVCQARREGRADGLPAEGAALLAELDQAVVGVEVGQAQSEGDHGGRQFRCVAGAATRRGRRQPWRLLRRDRAVAAIWCCMASMSLAEIWFRGRVPQTVAILVQ
jgi:hypothetical protein